MAGQLREMLTALRAECGHSTNVAHGLNDREAMVYLLDRTQLDLWESYQWPMLLADRDVALAPAQRYYSYPSDLRFEDIDHLWLLNQTQIYPLDYGITPEQFLDYDSDANAQSWPPRRWMHHGDNNTLEIWPIPDATAPQGRLRLRGTRMPVPLINDSDVATLPWRIIVLTAASEVLAREKDPAAEVKGKRASELIRRLRVRQSSHKSGVTHYGQPVGRNLPRVGLDYIPTNYGQGPRRS
jgi:hypothetical protein